MPLKDNGNQEQSDKSDKDISDVTFALSLLSLSGRIKAHLAPEKLAELATVAQHIPPRGDADVPYSRTGRRADLAHAALIADAPPMALPPKTRQLPPQWTVVHVIDRLEEAVEVLGRLPERSVGSSGSAWPSYKHEYADRIAQIETGEFERALNERNVVRRSATPAEITRMTQAMGWPADYLSEFPEVAKAVGLATVWAVQKADVRKRCAAIGIGPRAFIRRKMHGLNIITMGLIRARVAVT